MKGSDFILDFLHLLYHKCHKMNFKRVWLYIDSPDWIKDKQTTINLINKKGNKCFAITATLKFVTIRCNNREEEMTNDPLIISNIKVFIDKCNWEGIN